MSIPAVSYKPTINIFKEFANLFVWSGSHFEYFGVWYNAFLFYLTLIIRSADEQLSGVLFYSSISIIHQRVIIKKRKQVWTLCQQKYNKKWLGKECRCVHLTFPSVYFNISNQVLKWNKRKIVWTVYIALRWSQKYHKKQLIKNVKSVHLIKKCKSVDITFLFVYFKATTRCYNKNKEK